VCGRRDCCRRAHASAMTAATAPWGS
jgi:hypothetical protein